MNYELKAQSEYEIFSQLNNFFYRYALCAMRFAIF
jgi:hypothetical protein